MIKRIMMKLIIIENNAKIIEDLIYHMSTIKATDCLLPVSTQCCKK